MRAAAALAATCLLLASPAEAQVQLCEGTSAPRVTRVQIDYVSGGRTVRGLQYIPAEPNGRGVVLLHGARGLGDDALLFDPHALQLAGDGWHVLVPNYYDARTPTERRTSRDLRAWRSAATDAAAWLSALDAVEDGAVALVGWSLGGFLAVEAAMETPGVFAAAAVGAGMDVGEPGRARRALPTMIVHARRDPVVSPLSSRAWADGLRRRGAVVEVVEMDADGHGYGLAGWCDVFSRVTLFLHARSTP
jgi:dienelactone hydrolase